MRALLALLLVLFLGRAWADVTVGGGVRAFQNATASPAISLTSVPAGATVTVWIFDRNGGMTVTDCADDVDGSYGEHVASITYNTTWLNRMYRRHNSTGGSVTITCTLGASQNTQLVAMYADSDTGQPLEDDGAQFDTSHDTATDTSAASPTLAASAQPGVMVGGLETGSSQTGAPTEGAGTLLTTEVEAGMRSFAFGLPYTTTGSKQLTATIANNSAERWLVGLYREPAPGGTVVNPISGRGGAAAQPVVIH